MSIKRNRYLIGVSVYLMSETVIYGYYFLSNILDTNAFCITMMANQLVNM